MMDLSQRDDLRTGQQTSPTALGAVPWGANTGATGLHAAASPGYMIIHCFVP